MQEWYPEDKEKLEKLLGFLLNQKVNAKRSGLKQGEDSPKGTEKVLLGIHGLIVPHAGYAYSGEVAGKAFSLIKNKKFKKAIIFGPTHYVGFKGLASLNNLETPLGKVKIKDNFYQKLPKEHSIENQIPFLQKMNKDIEILPIVVGEISLKEAGEIAKQFSAEKDSFFIFSTDLSHFFHYEKAESVDRETIKIIESLNIKKQKEMDACGHFPLLILMNLCRKKGWKPKLIEYKNSGDVTGDKESVVGYASFVF
jgi:hypothetical protein